MRSYEVREDKVQSEWNVMTTRQVAELTAKDIYERYFLTKPFIDSRSRNFFVNNGLRVYMTRAEEYTEYMEMVVEILLGKLGVTLDGMSEEGGKDGE